MKNKNKNSSAALETKFHSSKLFSRTLKSHIYMVCQGQPISQFKLPTCPTSFHLGSLTSKTYRFGVDLQLFIED